MPDLPSFRNGSNLYSLSSTYLVCVCVLVTFQKHLCFQEIHTLQSKKTDVGELEKEREEAVQRLQVSLLPWSTSVYHGNHPAERTTRGQVRIRRSL